MTEYLHQLKQVEFTDFWLQAKSELFLKHLPHAKRGHALDLGAGTGLLTFKLAAKGWNVDAPDDAMISCVPWHNRNRISGSPGFRTSRSL